MIQGVAHDVSLSVEPIVVSDIRDLVEPVVCRGDETGDHEATEAECVDTGVGYVVYECPECGLRALYHHSKSDSDPCCSPRR